MFHSQYSQHATYISKTNFATAFYVVLKVQCISKPLPTIVVNVRCIPQKPISSCQRATHILETMSHAGRICQLKIRSMERGICPIAPLALRLTLYSLTGQKLGHEFDP